LRTDHQFPGEVQFHFEAKVKLYVAFGNQKPKTTGLPMARLIPKGLNRPAQGCEERATLGKRHKEFQS
jgi:hypothetical protein